MRPRQWPKNILVVAAGVLWLLMERTRLGAMIRAGVDDMEMARGVGIPASMLFTLVFCLGSLVPLGFNDGSTIQEWRKKL